MEVIAAVKRASGSDFVVRFSPPRAGDPAALVAEAHRIGEVLGWRPRHDDGSGAWSNTAPPLNITAWRSRFLPFQRQKHSPQSAI
jgi:hypothetical protein